MIFQCPRCAMQLKAGPELAGQLVHCPGCSARMQIPSDVPADGDSQPQTPNAPTSRGSVGAFRSVERRGWKETDPTNPRMLVSFGLGLAMVLIWFFLLLPFNPGNRPVDSYTPVQWLAALFFKHLVVSSLNCTFFCWAMAILYLKFKKLRHQKSALLLDVLPMRLGKEINVSNVAQFIDHVYRLPRKLRDSLMVNRIRKGLELFEIRANNAEVAKMMANQSDIDSARIGGSYTLPRAFLWAIPLLGFIGTVLGLSQAIGGMNFANVEDVAKIVTSINNVTSGLGTAFDATLLGLVLAMILNFPLNSLAKQEDDNLNEIDAFCNEVLMLRLNDGSGAGGGDTAAVADAVVAALAGGQAAFLSDLNELSRRMNEYATTLDGRMAAFQQSVTDEFVTKTHAMREQSQASIKESMVEVSNYLAGLASGINSLNEVLRQLGTKQIVIGPPPPKRRWFRRGGA